jgi:hypothetical protein
MALQLTLQHKPLLLLLLLLLLWASFICSNCITCRSICRTPYKQSNAAFRATGCHHQPPRILWELS